jgi:DNA-binding NtrC family response regulator
MIGLLLCTAYPMLESSCQNSQRRRMPPQVLIAHDEADFLDKATSALKEAGYHDIAAFSDATAALFAITGKVELLITRVAFPSGTQAGLALALMARRSRPDIKILFAARPEFRDSVCGLGEFLSLPVRIGDLVATVQRLMG